MMLTFETTKNIDSQIYLDSLSIRRKVFIEEQHVDPAIEIDEKEAACTHIVGYNDMEQPIVTARLYPLSLHAYKIQRVAVLKEYRGKHYGQEILAKIDDIAQREGIKNLHLGAQNQAISFYEQLGYVIDGEEYEEAGILHHDMKKVL